VAGLARGASDLRRAGAAPREDAECLTAGGQVSYGFVAERVQVCESVVTMRWVSTKVTNTRDNCSVLVLLAVVVLLAPKAPRTLARRKSLRWTARGLREAVMTVEVDWFIDGVSCMARLADG